MADVVSIDPRTGEAVEVVAQETTSAEVDRMCAAALGTAPELEGLGRAATGQETDHVLDKLGAANRTEAVARARDLGLLP